MTPEVIIILYVAICALLGTVFLLDFLWDRRTQKVNSDFRKANPGKHHVTPKKQRT